LNGLNGGVVVVLMDLMVNRLLDIFLFRSKDSPVLNSWVHRLVDGSLMLSISGEEIGNSCLRFVRFV
jgi:hypothetical protein